MADDERPSGPVIVRRRLAQELRRLRDSAGMNLDVVASEMEMSPSKLSRMETGHSPAKVWDVRNLLELYGVTDTARRDEIVGWARESKEPAWWQGDVVSATAQIDYFLSLEAEASAVLGYCTPVVPALLQTRPYARAHIAAIRPGLSKSTVEKQVSVRLKRQKLLRGNAALRYTAIIDESVLHRLVGTAEVLKEQLRALINPPRSVDLRILPFSAGPFRAITSPFTIFIPRLPDVDPSVVNVESALNETYTERTEEVYEYRTAFDALRNSSLDALESSALIESLSQGPV